MTDGFEDLLPHDESLPPLPAEALDHATSRSQLDFELGFYADVLGRSPNYIEVLRVMANDLTAKGDHQGSLGIDRRLTRLCPFDRIAHYNLACSYSLVGMIEPALGALAKALEYGYDEFAYLTEDRDLELVRKDPRFRELLESHGVA